MHKHRDNIPPTSLVIAESFSESVTPRRWARKIESNKFESQRITNKPYIYQNRLSIHLVSSPFSRPDIHQHQPPVDSSSLSILFVRSSVRPYVRPSVRSYVCPTVHPSVRPFVRPSVRPSVHPSVRPSIRPSTVYCSVYPTILPSVPPFIRTSIRPSVHPSARPSVRPPVRSSVRPSVYPTVLPSVRPSVRLSSCPSFIRRLPVRSSFHSSVRPSIHTSFCPFVRIYISPSLRPSVHPSVCPYVVRTSAQKLFPTSTCPSPSLLCLFVNASVSSVHLFASPSFSMLVSPSFSMLLLPFKYQFRNLRIGSVIRPTSSHSSASPSVPSVVSSSD